MNFKLNAAPPATGGTRQRRLRNAVLAAVVLAGVCLGVIAAFELGYFQPAPTGGGPALMQATCSSVARSNSTQVGHVASGGSGDHAYFLIVEGDPPSQFAGINGSYYVAPATQWPTMNVKVGQVVSIHVINCAASEPHGFQITYYDDISKNLISIPAGQSYDVTFTATRAGIFRVYCGIFCSIHPLMQDGALVVS